MLTRRRSLTAIGVCLFILPVAFWDLLPFELVLPLILLAFVVGFPLMFLGERPINRHKRSGRPRPRSGR
jgi:hypothetical protein